jgi:microcystin-dependent protein
MANLKIDSDAALDKDGFTQSYPVGTIIMRTNSTVASGWLLCDGRYVNTADYPELDSVVATAYGARVGATFRLPPLVVNATNNPLKRIPFSTLSSEVAQPTNFFHTHTLGINATSFSSANTGGHSHAANSSTTVAQSPAHNHAASTGPITTTSNAGGSENTRIAGPLGPYASGNSGQTGHSHATGTAWSSGTLGDSLSHSHTVNFHNATNLNHAHNHATNIASSTHVVSAGESATPTVGMYPPSMEVYFLIKT